MQLTVAVALIALAGAGCRKDEPTIAGPPTSAVLGGAGADAARTAVADAVDALLTGGPVATSTTGSADGQPLTIEARLDPIAGDASLDEVVGPITNEFVLLDDTLYVRIFGTADAGPDGGPPFSVLDPGPSAADFLWQPLLAAGRIFGDPEVLSAVLRGAPARVLSLGTRGDATAPEQGYRFVFDSRDIADLLIAGGFESNPFLPEPQSETTTIEAWIGDGLQELSAIGAMYQDGELIDALDVTMTIEHLSSADISAPPNTAP